jgi:hypothetical protein
MLKLKKPKVSLKAIEQEIDLKEIFGVDLSEADGLKKAIGQVLLDKMLTRVEGGQGIGGVKLKSPYSKVYSDSLEFKAAGKSRGSVNMSLTGDMLAGIDFEDSGNKITFKIAEDQVEKAYNHITGDTVPRRPFFGFTAAELKEIKREFAPRIKEAVKRDEAGGSEALLNALANDILETIDEEL